MTTDPAALLAGHDRCFWLDGGGSRAWSGDRSLVGVLGPDDVSLTFDAARREVVRHASGRSEVVGDDVFTVLAEELDGDPATHWAGYLGYAARPDLPGRPAGDPAVPDAVWMRSRDVRVLSIPSRVPEPGLWPALRHTTREEEPVPPWYADAFAAVTEQLYAGNTYEVNLTHREEVVSTRDPLSAYQRLRTTDPAPYAGFLRHGDVHLLSASPERFATIDRHRRVETRPIKGTTPRGRTPAEDEEQRARLAADPRYRAENLMIVDLLRNDLATVCEVGSVEVPTLMTVESYASVHQLVSTVRGRLRPEVGTLEALRSLFPAGSMTGAPKRRTMAVIDRVEATPRGVYAGAFGWISGDGRADLGVVIRSLVGTPADAPRAAGTWRYRLGTGGGITVHSDVASEWAETQWKAARLHAAAGPPPEVG